MSKEVDEREALNTWDDYDSLLYNEWLKVPMAPTKFAHERSLDSLGIEDGVMELVQRIGLTKLVTRDKNLYPDLVRQFFATVKLYNIAVSPEEKKDLSRFFMSFIANGKQVVISAGAVCRVLGFPEDPAEYLPNDIAGGVHTLWSRIGAGAFIVGSSTHTDVRHPVIRYLVRLFTTTILCKMEPGKMRKHELVLLSYALRDIVPNETWANGFRPNMGMVFMEYLHSLRHTPLTTTNFGKKQFTVGSMLTPLFKAAKVSTAGYSVDTRSAFVDLDHMKHAQWLKGENPLHWVFPIAVGQSGMVDIRSVSHLMPVTTDASLLFFEPAADLLKPVEATRKMTTRGASTSHPSTSQAQPPPHQHVFPSAPRANMNEEQRFQWLSRALQATWDAMACTTSCIRPRTPSPPRQPPEDASEFLSAEDED